MPGDPYAELVTAPPFDQLSKTKPAPRETLVRNSDPRTSQAAARSLSHKAKWTKRDAILGALWKPMTQYEIAKLTGLKPEQVHKRISELARDNPDTGYVAEVRDTGETKLGDAGRQCIVWEKIINRERK